MTIMNNFPANGSAQPQGTKHFVTIEGPMMWEIYSYSSGEEVSVTVDLGGPGNGKAEASDPDGNNYDVTCSKNGMTTAAISFTMPNHSLYIVVEQDIPSIGG